MVHAMKSKRLKVLQCFLQSTIVFVLVLNKGILYSVESNDKSCSNIFKKSLENYYTSLENIKPKTQVNINVLVKEQIDDRVIKEEKTEYVYTYNGNVKVVQGNNIQYLIGNKTVHISKNNKVIVFRNSLSNKKENKKQIKEFFSKQTGSLIEDGVFSCVDTVIENKQYKKYTVLPEKVSKNYKKLIWIFDPSGILFIHESIVYNDGKVYRNIIRIDDFVSNIPVNEEFTNDIESLVYTKDKKVKKEYELFRIIDHNFEK